MKHLVVIVLLSISSVTYAGKLTNAAVIGTAGYVVGKSGSKGGSVVYANTREVPGLPYPCYISSYSNGHCGSSTYKNVVKITEACSTYGEEYKVVGFIPGSEKNHVTLICREEE